MPVHPPQLHYDERRRTEDVPRNHHHSQLHRPDLGPRDDADRVGPQGGTVSAQVAAASVRSRRGCGCGSVDGVVGGGAAVAAASAAAALVGVDAAAAAGAGDGGLGGGGGGSTGLEWMFHILSLVHL